MKRIILFWVICCFSILGNGVVGMASDLKQEKIYIHIDKPFYLTGDTIWMKGYLVDAKTHKEQDVQSRFMYVELIDNKNKVLLRKKLKEENGIYRNFFHWKVIFLKDSICYGVIQIICVMGMRLSFLQNKYLYVRA